MIMKSHLALVTSPFHVILGTGPLARATGEALLARGQSVRFVSQSGNMADRPAGSTLVKADLLDFDAATAALKDAAVVYFCAQPPYHHWVEKFDALQASALAATRQVGARFIAAENLYGYGPSSEPFHEDMPLRPNTRKGEVRARMHQSLMAEHRAGNLKVAVARAADFFGARVVGSAVGERFVRAVKSGKPVEVMGNPDAVHAYTFIDDFGTAMAVLGTNDAALGEVWHVPNAQAVSTRRFIELAFSVAGTGAGRLRRMGRIELALVGLLVPPVRESIEMLYEFEEPFLVDHSKFAARFGDHATPLEAALARTLLPAQTLSAAA